MPKIKQNSSQKVSTVVLSLKISPVLLMFMLSFSLQKAEKKKLLKGQLLKICKNKRKKKLIYGQHWHHTRWAAHPLLQRQKRQIMVIFKLHIKIQIQSEWSKMYQSYMLMDDVSCKRRWLFMQSHKFNTKTTENTTVFNLGTHVVFWMAWLWLFIVPLKSSSFAIQAHLMF